MFGGLYDGKKVLVTGHTGFKGSWLTSWLCSLGASVVGYSKDIPTTPSLFVEAGLEEAVTHIKSDVRDAEELRRVVSETRPDFIFHLAAQPIVSMSYSDPLDTLSSNIMGTANILDAIRVSNLDSCVAILITSDKCYDNCEWIWGYREHDNIGGKDIYSGSKGAAELVIKSYYHSFFKDSKNIHLASARAGNVIGGGDWARDRIVPDCMRSWSQGKPVTIRSPRATRPWQHVLEPLSGYLQLGQALSLNPELSGESFNFGPKNEEVHSVRNLLEDLAKVWGFDDLSSAYSIVDEQKFSEAGLLKLNCDKAFHSLRWTPTLSHQELIDFTGSWYRNFYQDNFDAGIFTRNQISIYENTAVRKGISWTIA